jgi:hypothetical protein
MPLLRCVLLVAFAACGASAQSVKSCGGPADHLKNPTLKVTPDPPVKGSPLTIEVSGTLDEALTDVTSNVDLQIQALGIIHASVEGGAPLSLSPGAPAGPFSLTVGPFTPSSAPGKAVVKGQIHVVNTKNEPVMCIELDLDTPGEASEGAMAPVQIDAPAGITSCGKPTDHIPDLNVQASGGVTTMTGTLNEAVTQLSLDVDASIKVAFISVPLKATIPVAFTPGIAKGPIKAAFGPSTVVVKPELKAELKGTVKVNDPKADEVMCLNVDTVVGTEKLTEQALGNCKKASYTFCCEVGAPCDCTKGTTAPGQCKPESYGFCCSIGTPCDCSVPPVLGNVTDALVI